MRLQTYTNHTGMSQLVPVLEVMIGVTRHRLAFDIWRQAQLYEKNNKRDTWKSTFGQYTTDLRSDVSLTQWDVVLNHFVNKILRSAHFRMQEGAVTNPVRRKSQQQVGLLQLGRYLWQGVVEVSEQLQIV